MSSDLYFCAIYILHFFLLNLKSEMLSSLISLTKHTYEGHKLGIKYSIKRK